MNLQSSLLVLSIIRKVASFTDSSTLCDIPIRK